MGVLIPNYRRRIKTEFAGRTISSMETVAGIKDARVISITEGREEGSKGMDHAEYATLFAQVKPGTVARITAYGEADLATLRAFTEGELFSAVVTPITSQPGNLGFKLVEVVPSTPEVASQPAA